MARNNKNASYAARLNIAIVHNSLGNADTALSLLTKLEDRKETALESTDSISLFTALGQIFYSKQDYEKAEYYLKQALQRSRHLHVSNQMLESTFFLFKIQKARGDLMEALSTAEAYIALKDSIFTDDIALNVNNLEVKYRSAQKDRDLAQKQLLIVNQQHQINKKNIWLWGSISGIGLLSVLIFLLRRSFDNERKLTTELLLNKKQGETLLAHQKQLHYLQAMIEGEEKERSRIARELHDGIGGMLAAIKMNVTLQSSNTTTIKNSIKKTVAMIEATSEEVRRTAHNLMPDILIKNGLLKALTIYRDNIVLDGYLHIEIAFQGTPYFLSKSSELIIYRITQELIQNIVKHSGATQAAILMKNFRGKFSVIIEDNGKGFETDGQYSGIGLENLRYRVHALEGTLGIHSSIGKGTTIHIEFPMNKLTEIITNEN